MKLALFEVPVTVLVCGGRDFSDRARVFCVLDTFLYKRHPISKVVHGGARGADALAGEWARVRGVECAAYPADWSLGRGAGFARNAQMLRDEAPDVVIAFPGGRGTADMVRRAHAAGVFVVEVPP